MIEVWKDIENYEGLYQVSNLGRVRSLDRIVGCGKQLKGKEKAIFQDKYGYSVVCLCKDGFAKHWKVHRLVAISFLENPSNFPEINHKDENKENNRAENLEWCTTKHNINYGTRNEKVRIALSGEKCYCHKLTQKQVDEMRTLNKEDSKKYTARILSERYGISISQAKRILNRTRWR